MLIDVPGATMNGLKGYEHRQLRARAGLGGSAERVILSPNLTKARSLDAWAKEYARGMRGKRKPQRLEDSAVAGKYMAWVIK